MTEIQQTNIAVANYIIDELHKDKPFTMSLDFDQTVALGEILSESRHLHSNCINALAVEVRVHVINDKGLKFPITDKNADVIYHVLSNYIAVYEKPKNCIDTFIASGEFDKAFRDVFGL
ncbi:hypothetical protein, partial [Acinetobacter sp.]|uniref:hypothetical protein n=1 Tax=Acinetobacter sp. TaxID=472 RepID=UPI0039825C40